MALLTSSQQQMPLKNSFGKFDLQYGSIYIGLSICIILTGLFWCVAPSPAPFTWQCETTSSGRTGQSSPVSRYCCDRIISDITFQPLHFNHHIHIRTRTSKSRTLRSPASRSAPRVSTWTLSWSLSQEISMIGS